MPLTKLIRRAVAGVGMVLAVLAGPATSAWSQSVTAQMPRAIRAGAADMVVQRVEPEVSREEIFAAVQGQLDRETMCIGWPALWLLEAASRRREYIVRFDLMERDWGADVAERARVRMQELVDMGLLSARPRSDLGAGVIQYRPTPQSEQYLDASGSTGRMSFCMPLERRVVDIVSLEFGDFPCGTVQVRFSHSADVWPSWANNPAAQTRIAETVAPLGVPVEGSVSMSRQWFSDRPPDGRENGQLRSVCYDRAARQVRGEDMMLFAAPSAD